MNLATILSVKVCIFMLPTVPLSSILFNCSIKVFHYQVAGTGPRGPCPEAKESRIIRNIAQETSKIFSYLPIRINLYKEKYISRFSFLSILAEAEIIPNIRKKRTMDYTISRKDESGCLECGDSLRGRKDRKFCCLSCKNSYNNRRYREIRRYKSEIMSRLSRNYEILESLISDGEKGAKLEDLGKAGFDAGCITGARKSAGHEECSCFDISYCRTDSRIFNLRRKDISGQLSDPSPAPSARQ